MRRRDLVQWAALAALATRVPMATAGVPLAMGIAPGVQGEILDVVRAAAAGEGVALRTVLREREGELLSDLAAGRLQAACFDDGVRFATEARRRRVDLVAVTSTVTLPYALYSRRLRSPREVRNGETLALPRDAGATARALVLLHNHGLIGLREGAGLGATLADVARNPRRLKLQAFASENLFGALDGAALVVLDSATAARHGLQPARDAIGLEDARTPWAGVLAVRRTETGADWVAPLVRAYRSEAVKRFLLERFNDSVRRPW